MSSTAREILERFRTLKRRDFILQFVSLGLVVTSALMIWKGLILLTRSSTPVVVVLSEDAVRDDDLEDRGRRLPALVHDDLDEAPVHLRRRRRVWHQMAFSSTSSADWNQKEWRIPTGDWRYCSVRP